MFCNCISWQQLDVDAQAACVSERVYSHIRALQEQYAAELEAESDLQNKCEAACAAQQVRTPWTLYVSHLRIACCAHPALQICTPCFAHPHCMLCTLYALHVQTACFAHCTLCTSAPQQCTTALLLPHLHCMLCTSALLLCATSCKVILYNLCNGTMLSALAG